MWCHFVSSPRHMNQGKKRRKNPKRLSKNKNDGKTFGNGEKERVIWHMDKAIYTLIWSTWQCFVLCALAAKTYCHSGMLFKFKPFAMLPPYIGLCHCFQYVLFCFSLANATIFYPFTIFICVILDVPCICYILSCRECCYWNSLLVHVTLMKYLFRLVGNM